MKHIEKLANGIAEYGVEFVFGIPGSGPSLSLLDFLEKREVHFYLTHFEGTAAIMAGSIGRLSGKSQVAICIKGPGLTNMLPGLAACFLESLPLVSISEAYLPGTPLHKAHKRLDHLKILSGVTKGERFLTEKGPDFNRLAAWAESERPGPVHLNVADEPGTDNRALPRAGKLDNQSNLNGPVRDMIESSGYPAVIAGTLAIRKGWSSHLNSLKIPVFSTAAAKGVIDETLSHAAGVFTGAGGNLTPEAQVISKADLVIGLGLHNNEVLIANPFHCTSILVDPMKLRAHPGFEFTEQVEGLPGQVEDLFAVLVEKRWGQDILGQCKEDLRQRMLNTPFLPAHVFETIERHFQDRARVVLDTGNFCTIGEHIWRVPKPDWYMASGQGRYMGIGIPQGIACSLYDREVPTIVFTGDGGIGMFASEIKLAVQHRLPLIVVLLSDSFLGSIRGVSLQKKLTQAPARINQPSWVKCMEGSGVQAEPVENPSQLEKALQGWQVNSPLFVEVSFDPDEYQDMTVGIR
jgi:thiamine pyrophosphate-dependent acetolactate synthase large subunit-like protein